jgi:predicted NAD/FAD-binding protein
MIRDILRFNREAIESLVHGDLDLSLGEYLERGNFSDMFIQQYILPMGAAIWSTDPAQMQTFPARLFIRFFDHHGLLSVRDRPVWRVLEGGSRAYINPLTESFRKQIKLNSPVTSIRRLPTHVEVQARGQELEKFDAVFIAAHSDQALRMLADPSLEERSVLGAIKYQENQATIHTDERVLPANKRAWAAWNYHVLPQSSGRVAVTYNMNILQSIKAPVQFCVTLNNDRAVSRQRIIRKEVYEHPLYTPETIAAQLRQHEINGVKRTYYCGAYWRNGFHEDGVVSAMNALEHFEEAQNEQLSLRRAS